VRRVRIEPSFASWRDAARALLHEGVPPQELVWDDGSEGALLLDMIPSWSAPATEVRVRLPRRFVDVAQRVAAHRDPSRWELLYRVAFRIANEHRELLEIFVDDDVHRVLDLDRAVRRDLHKMHAFVRFTVIDDRYVAWYRPDHHILRLAAPFFVERFQTMQWSILTAEESAHWDGTELTFGAGAPRASVPEGDELASLWRAYYAAMFNPARLNLRKMRADMPTRFWRDLPELTEVARLITEASARVGSMLELQREAPSAQPFVPPSTDLAILRDAARNCEGCALFEPATQTVFGEGSPDAELIVIGEQPGDREDREGRPFIGPAGELLDRALAGAGIDRTRLYVTNAVKHFAFVERGKARIHRPPKTIEIAACRPWLDAELQSVRARVLVCLGSSAAKALLGGRVRVLRDRGQWFQTRDGRDVLVTLHPSAILRAQPSQRDEYLAMLTADLATAAGKLAWT
jgi:probable DNA metabolism protein